MRLLYPTLRKEMVLQIRGGRSFLFFSLYVISLAVVCVGAYALAVRGETASVGVGWRFGREVFGIVLFAQAALTLLVAPALLAGAIGNEIDEGTFPLLLLSPARPQEVLIGKLVPGLAFLALLIVGTLPLAGTCLAFGGVTATDVLAAYAGLFAVMVAHGVIGLFASTVFLRTAPAAVVSYGFVGLLIGLSLLEKDLLDSRAFLVGRALVLWAAVLGMGLALMRPVLHAVFQGLSHLGCGCVFVMLMGSAVAFLTFFPVTTGPLAIYLNPFAASVPFAGTGDWPGMPASLRPQHAAISAALHLGLAGFLLLGAYLRVRGLMLRRARSDPRHVVPRDLPGET